MSIRDDVMVQPYEQSNVSRDNLSRERPPRWGEGHLTETEVKAIIDIYNTNIDACTTENEILKDQINISTNNLKLEEKRVYQL